MARGRFVGKILVQGWDLKSRRLFCQSNVPVEPRFLEGLELRGGGGQASTKQGGAEEIKPPPNMEIIRAVCIKCSYLL